MIIELPEKLTFGGKTIPVVNGVARIPISVNWRTFVYKITVDKKGKQCWYCGKPLKKEEITMDHLYPQDLGGPTIPNNLAPCCSICNSKKGCLTEWQYRQFLNAPENKKKAIKARFAKSREYYKCKSGFFLPKGWITTREIDSIFVKMLINETYLCKQYRKIEGFYKVYGHLPYPIVVDRNNYLLDGFLVLMFAKNNNITKIPTIVIKNIEMVMGE